MKKEYRDGSAEDNEYYDFIEQLTDRELQEQHARYLRNIEKTTMSIKKNVQFWFYVTIISVFLIGMNILDK